MPNSKYPSYNLPHTEQLLTIGESVSKAVQELFWYADVEYDFCIRITGPTITFGDFNRVVFDPIKGLRAIRLHCSAYFISKADDMGIDVI